MHRKYVMIEYRFLFCFAYISVAIRNHTSNDFSSWSLFVPHIAAKRSWMTGQQCALWNWATWHAFGGQQKSVSSILRKVYIWVVVVFVFMPGFTILDPFGTEADPGWSGQETHLRLGFSSTPLGKRLIWTPKIHLCPFWMGKSSANGH